MKNVNSDIKIMLVIYQTTEYDWLGDKIHDVNKLTKHHIMKKELGGENGVSNYALLTPKSHKLVHLLEEKDPALFENINLLFLELNRSMQPPTENYYKRINNILRKNKSLTKEFKPKKSRY